MLVVNLPTTVLQISIYKKVKMMSNHTIQVLAVKLLNYTITARFSAHGS